MGRGGFAGHFSVFRLENPFEIPRLALSLPHLDQRSHDRPHRLLEKPVGPPHSGHCRTVGYRLPNSRHAATRATFKEAFGQQ